MEPEEYSDGDGWGSDEDENEYAMEDPVWEKKQSEVNPFDTKNFDILA